MEAVAAKALNVSERPVSSAKKNLREGAKEVVAAVNKGDLSVHAASEILRASGLALAGVGRQALKATKPTAVGETLEGRRLRTFTLWTGTTRYVRGSSNRNGNEDTALDHADGVRQCIRFERD